MNILNVSNKRYAVINGTIGMLSYIIIMVLGLVNRAVLLPLLGASIVGLIATFNDILTILNMTDMGMTAAISVSLYQPVLNKEYSLIKGILGFYKKIYKYAGIVFSILAIAVAGWMYFNLYVETISSSQIVLYFLLTASHTSISYFVSYRLILLSADKKLFKLKTINILYQVVVLIIKILAIKLTKSYELYLMINVIALLIYAYLMNTLISRKFYIDVEQASPYFSNEIKSRIIRMFKGVAVSKLGTVLVSATNNIYVSLLEGLASAALFNNYYMIVTSLRSLINSIFDGVTSIIGESIYKLSELELFEMYRITLLLFTMIATVLSVAFGLASSAFIRMWIGNEYLMDSFDVLLISVYLYYNLLRPVSEKFKTSAGYFYEDRFVSLFEGIANMFFCLSLGYYMGITGVLIGNLLTTVFIGGLQKPYMAFKYVFKRKLKHYFIDVLALRVVSILSAGLSYLFVEYMIIPKKLSNILEFLMAGTFSVIIPVVVFSVIYIQDGRMKYIFRQIIKGK